MDDRSAPVEGWWETLPPLPGVSVSSSALRCSVVRVRPASTSLSVSVSPVLQCRDLAIASQEHREPARRRVNIVFTTDELFVESPDRDVEVDVGTRYSDCSKPWRRLEKEEHRARFRLQAGEFDVRVRFVGESHASTYKFVVTGDDAAAVDAVVLHTADCADARACGAADPNDDF
jgi:hypothetical protein